jgi:hypothetical protein
MRLWTIHPRYLDPKGLVAVWREGLLAQKVLQGETRGYTRHPQLHRFRTRSLPVACVASYLFEIANEADCRGYKFDRTKIAARRFGGKLTETRGQLLFEWSHLKRKLRVRAPKSYRACCKIDIPCAHPLFRIVPGPVRAWEKTKSRKSAVSRAWAKNRRVGDGKSNVSSRS